MPSPLLPRLAYQDPNSAIEFLCRAFGFTETARFPAVGQIVHAEVAWAGCRLCAVGSTSAAVVSPHQVGATTVHSFVDVADVNAHYAVAHAAGARTMTEPRDRPWGERSYDVLDLEGHRWTFREHIEDVPLDELQQRIAAARLEQ